MKFLLEEVNPTEEFHSFQLKIGDSSKVFSIPGGPPADPDSAKLAILIEESKDSHKKVLKDSGVLEIDNQDKEIAEELKKGFLKFKCKGKYLKGKFDLVQSSRMHGKAWMLINRNSESDSELTKLEEKVNAIPDIQVFPESEMPTEISEMTLSDTNKIGDPKDWIFEPCIHGDRVLAFVDEGSIELKKANGNSLTKRLPKVINDLRKIGHSVVLDG